MALPPNRRDRRILAMLCGVVALGTTPTPAHAATDRTPPLAAFTTPAAGALVGRNATSTVTVTDNRKVSRAELWVAGTFQGRRTSAPWRLTADLHGRSGATTLQWRVFDAAGNRRLVNRVVTVDSTAPTVRIIKDLPAGSVAGKQPFQVAVSDDHRVRAVQLLLNGKVAATDTTAPYRFTVDGSRNLTIRYAVRAIDTVGNARTTAARYRSGQLAKPPTYVAPTSWKPVLVGCTHSGPDENGAYMINADYDMVITGGRYSFLGSGPDLGRGMVDIGWNGGPHSWVRHYGGGQWVWDRATYESREKTATIAFPGFAIGVPGSYESVYTPGSPLYPDLTYTIDLDTCQIV
ncbi:Ig-like domain-containing protein [Actinoplanes sp. NPDC049548]|uniref:Ig-like domain-containing protein n=1 Tax=Actinoplanes sp. NPDC049548 TaxID=3155152 RepID=UPI00341D4B43